MSLTRIVLAVALLASSNELQAQSRGAGASAAWPLVVGLLGAVVVGLSISLFQRELESAGRYVGGLLLMFGLAMGTAVVLVALGVVPKALQNECALAFFIAILIGPAVLQFISAQLRGGST